jgi:hypothetical protein
MLKRGLTWPARQLPVIGGARGVPCAERSENNEPGGCRSLSRQGRVEAEGARDSGVRAGSKESPKWH